MDRARVHYCLVEAGLQIVQGMCTLVQKEDKHFFCKEECTFCFDYNASEAAAIYRYKEIEEGESSYSLKHVEMQRTESSCP